MTSHVKIPHLVRILHYPSSVVSFVVLSMDLLQIGAKLFPNWTCDLFLGTSDFQVCTPQPVYNCTVFMEAIERRL